MPEPALHEIPLGLKQAIESNDCVLFVGAGIGFNLKNPDNERAPLAEELAAELAEHFDIETDDNRDLAKIAEVVQLRKGRENLESFVRARLAKMEPDDVLRWLFQRRWKAIYTTNYDRGIERGYELVSNAPQRPFPITVTSQLRNADPLTEVPIYYLHGTLFGTDEPRIIITETDYVRFREHRRMIFELLKRDSATSPILYLGYSHDDYNWRILFDEIQSEFYPTPMPRSYRVAPSTPAVDREILLSKNIETIDATCSEFIEFASVDLQPAATDAEAMNKARQIIPPDLRDAFDKNPAPLLRLLASWTFVPGASFTSEPNTRNFLRGDKPNWALVGKGVQFERDIEDELNDYLVDFATSSESAVRLSVLIGPAGYGVSTVLMAQAVKLVKDGVKPVFALKPQGKVLEGDIEYAVGLFDERPFFFIDNAADFTEPIQNVRHKLKESKSPAMVVMGEHLNEWRQRHGRLNGKEFEVSQLSENEIGLLLNCLESNKALGQLQDLPQDLRVAAIRQKHELQLLVAMREATEGKSFDAILESEYRSIEDDLSQRLYLLVCCFYQHGAYLRDEVLASLLDVSLVEMYERTRDWTEGVVIHEVIDDFTGTNGLRARHRMIAEVVWERCSPPGDRGRILRTALSSLNLNFAADKTAFEQFVRSDKVVDSIATFDGKVEFFETACQKDPDSPYVRQHFARMLTREHHYDSALRQIDEAIELGPTIRVLYHTKGVILSRMAGESLGSIARKRLIQAEDCFKRMLQMYPRDEYAYHGLAELYLQWATLSQDPQESSDYISKAEETITEGLAKVHMRERLWIVSSDIQSYLGDNPASLAALERAVQDSPTSVVARLILARKYRKENHPEKAIDVLNPVIQSYPDEFRSYVEYARSLLAIGRPFAECIAVLRLGDRRGRTDPRFVATLGGLLYLNGQHTEANEIFVESSKQNFTIEERKRIGFKELDYANDSTPIRQTGHVIATKGGVSWFGTVDEKLRVFYPGIKIEDTLLTQGDLVSFELGFTARGPVATNVQVG